MSVFAILEESDATKKRQGIDMLKNLQRMGAYHGPIPTDVEIEEPDENQCWCRENEMCVARDLRNVGAIMKAFAIAQLAVVDSEADDDDIDLRWSQFFHEQEVLESKKTAVSGSQRQKHLLALKHASIRTAPLVRIGEASVPRANVMALSLYRLQATVILHVHLFSEGEAWHLEAGRFQNNENLSGLHMLHEAVAVMNGQWGECISDELFDLFGDVACRRRSISSISIGSIDAEGSIAMPILFRVKNVPPALIVTYPKSEEEASRLIDQYQKQANSKQFDTNYIQFIENAVLDDEEIKKNKAAFREEPRCHGIRFRHDVPPVTLAAAAAAPATKPNTNGSKKVTMKKTNN